MDAETEYHPIERAALIVMVMQMMGSCRSAEDIVDAILDALTPEDGAECPVCGIAP